MTWRCTGNDLALYRKWLPNEQTIRICHWCEHCIDSVYDSGCLEPLPVNEWLNNLLRIAKLRFVTVNTQLITNTYALFTRPLCKSRLFLLLKLLAVDENFVDRKQGCAVWCVCSVRCDEFQCIFTKPHTRNWPNRTPCFLSTKFSFTARNFR